MATPGKLKSRFAPLPIETIFHSVRKPAQAATIGPNPELTPDPSPLSASPTIPEPQHRVRFHPQLIETSRRTRRAGASGPATKPADKTDITPYTNHIYQVKHKLRRRRGNSSPDDEPGRHMPPTRRETDEEGAKQYLLQLAASHASRQFEEAALAAFPNSRAREGGVAHFYFRDSSSSENSADDACPSGHHGLPRPLRKSTNLGLNWWHKHMQEHAQYISHDRRSDVPAAHVDDTLLTTDSDLDKMDLSVPPNPLWTTGNKAASQSRPGALAALQTPSKSPMAVAHPDPFTVLGLAQADPIEPQTSQASLPSESLGIVATRQPVSVEAPDPGRQHPQHGFGGPFQSFGLKPEDPELPLMRQAASPPMPGKDLIFRRCPSPKQTKLETDHPFVEQGGPRGKNRDVSGQGGLWKGYCYRSESDNVCITADAHRTNIIVTPQPPASPREIMTSRPPSEGSSSEHSSSDWTESPASSWTAAPRSKNGQAKGLHMLYGLDERLHFAKAQAERDEKILHEFNDEFVTQVYNYLSLGYPATARAFDDELAKISRVSVEELCRDDNKLMAKGHMLELNIDLTPEDARCPRWKALKIYIFEWARQHPDLDRLDPLGWGVRERKDSWAI